jgi:hypothetical protein
LRPIEIQDGGPYYEVIRIVAEKQGLTLRGAKGCWPIIRSGGPLGGVATLVAADASDTALEHMVIARVQISGHGEGITTSNACRLSMVIWGANEEMNWRIGPGSEVTACLFGRSGNSYDFGIFMAPCSIKDSLLFTLTTEVGNSDANGPILVDNTLAAGNTVRIVNAAKVRRCTFEAALNLDGGPNSVSDSILSTVVSEKQGTTVMFSNVTRVSGLATLGEGCLSADPQFMDAKNFDYRLGPKSPCRKKASDGGDLGCHYTPEMIEVLREALILRQQGLIKF